MTLFTTGRFYIYVLSLLVFHMVSAFVDDSVLEQLANFSCGEVWKCPSNDSGRYLPCACDDLCEISEDCCQGYQVPKLNVKQVDPKSFECIPSPLVENGESNVMMITKCPKDWKEERIQWLCESSPLVGSDIFRTIHVSGTDTGFMYKNQYCAKCHQESFHFWLPSVGCNESFVFPNEPQKNYTLPELLKSKSQCTIAQLNPPDGHHVRRCLLTNRLVDYCSQSWKHEKVKEMCVKTKGIQPVYYLGIPVKNIYCGYCGIPDISVFSCPDLRQTVRFNNFYPFSILFDINAIENDDENVVVCANDQVYDPFVDICRDTFCSKDLIFRDGECVLTEKDIGWLSNLDCPHILLNRSEFEITENGQLIELNSNYAYDPGFFKLLEDSDQAVVCTNFTRNSTAELQYSFDDVQTILSVIGISISILGCVLTISVYLGFKSLRNIPGRIVISLCVSLVLAYLTMLIGPALEDSYIACKIFAILMHFFFLVCFFWMNVMAIDVWYTFAYHQAGGSSEKSSRFKFYALYVFIAASIPVSVSIILNEVKITYDILPHYGEGICWFNRRNALLIFFGLPTLLALLTNVILFLIAARTIYKAQKNSVRLLGKEDKSMFSIYIRLTIVMGVSYLLGILVPLYNHPAILYIFIILNALQGLFIFVSFVCTHKVLGLIRERANIWNQSRSDTSYSGSGSRSTTKSSALSFRPQAHGKFN